MRLRLYRPDRKPCSPPSLGTDCEVGIRETNTKTEMGFSAIPFAGAHHPGRSRVEWFDLFARGHEQDGI
jgi:hypothetical protein